MESPRIHVARVSGWDAIRVATVWIKIVTDVRTNASEKLIRRVVRGYVPELDAPYARMDAQLIPAKPDRSKDPTTIATVKMKTVMVNRMRVLMSRRHGVVSDYASGSGD